MPGFEAKQLYIKLDKKLILNAEQINVTKGIKSDTEDDGVDIPQLSKSLNFLLLSIESIHIDTLYIEEHNVTVSYNTALSASDRNRISIKGPQLQGNIDLRLIDNELHINTKDLRHLPSDILLAGSLLYQFKEQMGYAKVRLSLSRCADLELYLKENGQALAFSAESFPFEDLAPIIQLFHLDPSITQWILGKNNAASYQLIEAKGIHTYNDINTLLDTLSLHAVEKDLDYTFHEDLYPIVTPRVDVSFKKGILHIRPSKPRYHEHALDAGNVKIDFNGEHALLNIELQTISTLDQEILDILQAYGIPLPLKQENGKSKAHLKIVVDLKDDSAYAIGQFFIKDSDLYLTGSKYHVNNASVRLHKNLLYIDTADIHFQDIFSARLNAEMDLVPLTGSFFFDTTKIRLGLGDEHILSLSDKRLPIEMRLDKEAQSFHVPDAHWKLDEHHLTSKANILQMREKFSSIIEFKDLQLLIQNMGELYAHGHYDIPKGAAALDVNLTRLNIINEELNVSSTKLPVNFHLDHENNSTELALLTPVQIRLNEHNLSLMPTQMQLHDKRIDVERTPFSFDGILDTEVSLHHSLGSKQLTFDLKNTDFYHSLLNIRAPFKLNYTYGHETDRIAVEKFNIEATLNQNNEMDLHLNDLKKLRRYSNIMKHYDIKAGAANLTFIKDRIGIDMTIKNFHPLISIDEKPVTTYTIKGDYANKTTNLQINKNLDLIYHNKGKLTAKGVDFNLFPILRYLERIDSNESDSDLELIVKTKNCGVLLGESGRKILSESINMQINNTHIQAQLIHGKGGVLFESEDGNLSVFGRGLNDQFMNKLFKFSTMKGGELSFSMQGPYDDMKGIIQIDKTIIKDYTVLNNTLAFFNTIPSLLTFSVPGYSSDGLEVEQMYGTFEKQGDIMKIKDTKITSKELIITAEGESDFKKETIDLLMQVKTDIGSSAKDIPIIGYIIFGEDSVSTTVRVYGDLKDPKVENSVAKNIMVAPLNIIKRTITLPLLPFFEDDNSTQP